LNVNGNDVEDLLEYIQELTELQLKGQLFALGRDLSYQIKENADQIEWNDCIFATDIGFYVFERYQDGFDEGI
jgi:hypothetical protein